MVSFFYWIAELGSNLRESRFDYKRKADESMPVSEADESLCGEFMSQSYCPDQEKLVIAPSIEKCEI